MSKEKDLSNINFFICSTYEDLKDYRAAVINKIKSKAGIINAQEFFGSRDQKPLQTCMEEVRKSNVFVMFIAHRLGSLDNTTGKSYIECEYDKAVELKLPKLVYFMDEEHPFPPKYVSRSSDGEKLNAFKTRLKKDHTIDFFTTSDDLAQKVVNDLQRQLPSVGFVLGSESDTEGDNETETLLEKFVLLPKVFYGSEITIDIILEDYERATKPECDAFSLRYGATLRRKFHATDKRINKLLAGNGLNQIWASDEVADMLLTAPSNSQLKAVLKMIQGEYSEETPIYAEEKPNSLSLTNYSYTFGISQYRVVDYKVKQFLKCGLRLSRFVKEE